MIPFTKCIPEDKRDRSLGEKLKAEAAGILNWALAGLADYQQYGLKTPAVVNEATVEYRQDQDMLRHFLEARCTDNPGARVAARPLYDAYRRWATETEEWIMNERQFSQALAERGFRKIRQANGIIWEGVGLASDDAAGASRADSLFG